MSIHSNLTIIPYNNIGNYRIRVSKQPNLDMADCYDRVKSISLFGRAEAIDDVKIIDEIKNLILNVSYSETDKNILDYYGTTMLTMVCEDGSLRAVSLTSELILDDGKTYALGEDICSKIREYFN